MRLIEPSANRQVAYLVKSEVERFFDVIPATNARDRLLFDVIYRYGLRRASFESALDTMQKIVVRDQIQPAIRQKMSKRIAPLRRRAALPRTYPPSISRLPSAERQAFGDCLELIYECSQDKAEAKLLIDRILRKLTRRQR